MYKWCGWIAAALVTLGCFSEAPSGGDGQGCDRGAAGCPCDDGACADALACMTELDLCIPDGCDPGTELCTCHDGECFGDLRCDGGLCRAHGSGSDESTVGGNTGASAGETIADASSMGGSEVGETTASATITTTASTTSPSDTGDTTDVEGGMSDIGDSGVDGSVCHDCLVASFEAGSECEMAFSACAPNRECMMLATCVIDAIDADDPGAIAACCDAHAFGAPAYGDLADCWTSACPMGCSEFVLSC